MLKLPLILMGHKGVGKTTLGLALSQKMGFKHIDTDDLLREHFQSSNLREIYESLGEEKFRQEESLIIQKLKPTHSIISIGGGSCENPSNQTFLSLLGTLIWIEEMFEEAYSRFSDTPLPYMPPSSYAEKIRYRQSLFEKISHYRIQKSSLPNMIQQIKDLYYGK